MMRMKKLWIVVALAAMLIGFALIAGVFLMIGFDFAKLNTETYARAEYALEGTFEEIEINTSFFDVKVVPVDAEEAPVVYLPYSGNITHNVSAKEGKLSIFMVDARAWYERLFFGDVDNENTTIELRLPHAQYKKLNVRGRSSDVLVDGKNDEGDALLFETVRVETNSGNIEFCAGTTGAGGVAFFTDTGDVLVGGVQNSALSVETDTGLITLLGCSLRGASVKTDTGDILLAVVTVTQGPLFIEGDSGDIEMQNVSAVDMKIETDTGDVEIASVLLTGEMRIQTNTGEIDIKHSDAKELYLETDTGDVEMELLSGKMFTVKTDTGDSRYPASDRNGGICVVETDTGDVEITLFSGERRED